MWGSPKKFTASLFRNFQLENYFNFGSLRIAYLKIHGLLYRILKLWFAVNYKYPEEFSVII